MAVLTSDVRFLVFKRALRAAIALEKEIGPRRDQSDDHGAADPCGGRLFCLVAKHAEMLGRVEFAGSEVVFCCICKTAHSLRKRMAGGMGKQATDVLPEQRDVLADA